MKDNDYIQRVRQTQSMIYAWLKAYCPDFTPPEPPVPPSRQPLPPRSGNRKEPMPHEWSINTKPYV
ncbi:MAG: hypothetical protein ABR915_20045 [Thermoguttaceae bacterium]|jgi:hypothetical protein